MEGCVGLVRVVLLLNEFKVKLANNQSSHAFAHIFGKSLSQTDSFSSQKRPITHRVSLVSERGQEVGALWVKSFWDVLRGCDPFVWVVVEVINVNHNLSPLLKGYPC